MQPTLSLLAAQLGGVTVEAENAELPGLRPGRAALLLTGGAAAGVLGELDSVSLDTFGLRGRVLAGELRLDAVAEAALRPPRFSAPPQFPPILRDLAVTVPSSSAAADALRVIRAAAGDLLEDADLYDEFRGGRLEPQRKGWTFHLRFRASDRTLTAEEAQATLDRVVGSLKSELGAELRS
ncbi:MAG: hypothetical protein JOY68_04105 [Candidatus Dormibacteraeota bacterium]|nr:hypothetical protein [Candidatus Dormibacteraeota bacterium]